MGIKCINVHQVCIGYLIALGSLSLSLPDTPECAKLKWINCLIKKADLPVNYVCVSSYHMYIHVQSNIQQHQNLLGFSQIEAFKCPYSYVPRLTVTRELKELAGSADLTRQPPRSMSTPETTAAVLEMCINIHRTV